MLWFKLKPWFEQNQCFCVQTIFYTKSWFTQKLCYPQTPCFTQKPCSCWACARAACGLQDGSFHGGWTRRRRLNMCRSWANSSQRRAAVEERQSRAEENMRALRAKANADMLQNVFSILTWSMTTIIIVRNINHYKIQGIMPIPDSKPTTPMMKNRRPCQGVVPMFFLWGILRHPCLWFSLLMSGLNAFVVAAASFVSVSVGACFLIYFTN